MLEREGTVRKKEPSILGEGGIVASEHGRGGQGCHRGHRGTEGLRGWELVKTERCGAGPALGARPLSGHRMRWRVGGPEARRPGWGEGPDRRD